MLEEPAIIYKIWKNDRWNFVVCYKNKDIYSSPYEDEAIGYCIDKNIPYEIDSIE